METIKTLFVIAGWWFALVYLLWTVLEGHSWALLALIGIVVWNKRQEKLIDLLRRPSASSEA